MADYIPGELPQILWNDDDDLKITEVCVVDIRDGELRDRLADGFDNSYGAILPDG
jgi:hypothetical protein